MNKIAEILIGLILLVIPIAEWIADYTGLGFGSAATTVLKGSIVWILILIGAVLLVLGISDLKS